MLKLKKATYKNAELLFQWANDPLVRESAFNQTEINWEDHLLWFKNVLSSLHKEIFILEKNNESIGQIRLEYQKGWWKIDYSIDTNFRGLGYGKQLIEIVLALFSERRFLAQVKRKNASSIKIFQKLGFNLINQSDSLEFTYLPEKKVENIILLSSRVWNKKIYFNLQEKFREFNWIWIDEKSELTIEKLLKIDPKYIFIPHWSYIIPEKIHSIFQCILFHMTDLPYGRGGSPLQNLILNKKSETVISAIEVIKELDAGPIYLKRPLNLNGSAHEIFLRARGVIQKMIEEIIINAPDSIKQTGSPTLFKRRKPNQSNLKDAGTVKECYDFIRMLDCEGYPKAFLNTEKLKFEFENAHFTKNKELIANVRIFKK